MLKLRKGFSGDVFEVSRTNIIPDICSHMDIVDSWKYKFVFMNPENMNIQLNHVEVLSLEDVDTLLLVVSKYTPREFIEIVDGYYIHILSQYSPTFPLILTFEDRIFESCMFSLSDADTKRRCIPNVIEDRENYYVRYIIDGEEEELTKYTCRTRICQLKLGKDITQGPIVLHVKIHQGRDPRKEYDVYGMWAEEKAVFYKAIISILEDSGYVRVDSRYIINRYKWTKKEYVPDFYIIENNIVHMGHDYGEYYDYCTELVLMDDDNDEDEEYV
jgi:hypothetical protein